MGNILIRKRVQSRGMADALFSATQKRVLGLLYGNPARSYYTSEIIARSGIGTGAVQRELARLEATGLATVRRIGSQKHYQANQDSPVFEELWGIVRKTVGLADPLRKALAPVAKRIVAAFVYGSVARQSENAHSDIDLMIISDELGYPDIFSVLEPASAELGRPVNPTVYSRAEFQNRRNGGNAFLTRVLEQRKIWIVGGENDLPA